MKKIILICCLSISATVLADCHIRSAIKINRSMVLGQPTDLQQMVTVDQKQRYQCTVRYRLNVKLDWQTLEGTGTGSTETQACAQAIDISRASILQEVSPTTVRANTQMVCTDFPDIRVHPVRIGDIIWESETDIHSVPAERPYFTFKRTRCRMFAERDTKDQNLMIWQGVICKLNSTTNSKWQVIDKY
jgi:hypothetical protein